MLPFEQGCDNDPHIAVRIIPELNQAFNTKERAPFKIIMETLRYNEIKEHDERTQQQDIIFNKSPKNPNETPQIILPPSDDLKSSASEHQEDQPEALDEWENISYSDINLDGMSDPYANKFKNTIREYRKLSSYSMKYDSWSLNAFIVKANDDVRQEVLAIQLMKRLNQIF